jgi:hypothetical protein
MKQIKPLNIKVIFKSFINNIAFKLLQKTCSHKDRYNKFTCYQDRYYEDYCPNCDLTIYTGMDD